MDFPRGGGEEASHFGGGDVEVVEPGGGDGAVADAHADLAGEFSGAAVGGEVGAGGGVGGGVRVGGFGDDLGGGGCHLIEGGEETKGFFARGEEAEVVAQEEEGLEGDGEIGGEFFDREEAGVFYAAEAGEADGQGGGVDGGDGDTAGLEVEGVAAEAGADIEGGA